MKLFDEIHRIDKRRARYTEPDFDYLNRSARPESQRVRELLERWFEHIPSETQSDIRSRFRDKDNRQHIGAFFELYLHELLLRLEFDIEVHPQVDGESTHPDFLVMKGGKRPFYLEATIAAPSDAEAAANARKNQVYDTLNRMRSPNFFVGIRVGDLPKVPPPGRAIRSFLERKLADLDPDEIAKRFKQDGFRAMPLWDWEHGDWRISFYPIPKSASARGKPDIRPIGMEMQDPDLLTPHVRIRESVSEKASKYGRLDLPYIVALNVIDEFGVDDIDIENGLFGEERVTFVLRRNDSIEQIPGRKPNGAWWGPYGPRNKRVGAVLMAVNLDSWSLARETPILWHNPWAISVFPEDIWSLPQLVPDHEDDRMTERAGVNCWQVLGLYSNWPNDYGDG